MCKQARFRSQLLHYLNTESPSLSLSSICFRANPLIMTRNQNTRDSQSRINQKHWPLPSIKVTNQVLNVFVFFFCLLLFSILILCSQTGSYRGNMPHSVDSIHNTIILRIFFSVSIFALKNKKSSWRQKRSLYHINSPEIKNKWKLGEWVPFSSWFFFPLLLHSIFFCWVFNKPLCIIQNRNKSC